MSDIAIRVEGLGKRYKIGASQAPYRTLRETIVDLATTPTRMLVKAGHGRRQAVSNNTMWALKDVSFEVKRGEVLGIIGRNGAGKSTLLKVLSRITKPTEGSVILDGRVGSLLEVGTGFHPELTGRENIYLNGAILGMRRTDIDRVFDEIVGFADIERFLDTPVKHYSTGMYMRIAFSVAAHMNPEIMLVDEVLAVGDAEFQKKCLGKMGDVARSGRTVLFVSHNMNAIERLSSSCILLREGRLESMGGNVSEVIGVYTSPDGPGSDSEWQRRDGSLDNDWLQATRFAVVGQNGDPLRSSVSRAGEAWVEVDLEIRIVDPSLTIGYALYSQEGTPLYWSYQTDGPPDSWPTLSRGRNTIRSRLPLEVLNEGTYRVELVGGLHFRKWFFEPMVSAPSVLLRVQGDLSSSPYYMERRPVLLAPILRWFRT